MHARTLVPSALPSTTCNSVRPDGAESANCVGEVLDLVSSRDIPIRGRTALVYGTIAVLTLGVSWAVIKDRAADEHRELENRPRQELPVSLPSGAGRGGYFAAPSTTATICSARLSTPRTVSAFCGPFTSTTRSAACSPVVTLTTCTLK
jgi:hypothetical protein